MSLAKIKLFLTDIDGVMTDGLIYYTNKGTFSKGFHVHDGLGMLQLKKAGIKTGIITSESSEIVVNRAKRLLVDFLEAGREKGSKLPAAEEICRGLGVDLSEVSYIGDDINCLDLLERVGYPACPQNGVDAVKAVKGIYCTQKKGGEGAVREWIDYLWQRDLFYSISRNQ